MNNVQADLALQISPDGHMQTVGNFHICKLLDIHKFEVMSGQNSNSDWLEVFVVDVVCA